MAVLYFCPYYGPYLGKKKENFRDVQKGQSCPLLLVHSQVLQSVYRYYLLLSQQLSSFFP